MKRADADKAMEMVLGRFFEARGSRPVSLITQLAVFGSYARGAMTPHYVDVHVTYEVDDEFAEEVVWALPQHREQSQTTTGGLACAGRRTIYR